MTPAVPRPVVDPALLNGPGALTQWANLGFWKGTTTYAEAAAELARRVGLAAKLGPDDVVLDLACGFGDSLAMWVREFGVARVVGVETDPAVVVDATARVRGWQLADRIALRCEAAEYVTVAQTCPNVTAVVCVDAAYHFVTRARWLKELAKELPKGTRLALADLLVSPRGERSHRIRTMAAASGIPKENLWTAFDVEPVLSDAGFRLERMVRCGNDVLGGFARHALRRAGQWVQEPGRGGWRALATAAAIGVARRRERLDYAIISAVRV
jgi:cyclopropane fatty-acyl-phospholipid synthase-like methyltransferase